VKINYLTIWDFAYKELSGENWRKIDFQEDNASFMVDNLIVYIELTRPQKDSTEKPKYSGKFLIRKIKQTVRRHSGIKPGFVALLLEEAKITSQIEQKIANILTDFNKYGTLISPP
jgi:hypothetical protein